MKIKVRGAFYLTTWVNQKTKNMLPSLAQDMYEVIPKTFGVILIETRECMIMGIIFCHI